MWFKKRGCPSIMKSEWSKKKVVVYSGILCVAAVAWFAFGRARGLIMVGFVDSAIGRLRAVVDAEKQFADTHPQIGYTCKLSELAHSNGVLRLLKDGTDNGYAFGLSGCNRLDVAKPSTEFRVTARPLHDGLPAFCSDQSGIVRSDPGGSVEKCFASGIPLGS
jgi:hypothetical protein